MKKALEALFVLSMVGMMVMGTVSLAIADGGQKWYFNNASADNETFAVDEDNFIKVNKFMRQGDPSGPGWFTWLGWPFGCLSGDDNDDAWFYAKSPVSMDTTLSNEGWSANIVYSSSPEPKGDDTIGELTVQVGKVDKDGNWTKIAEQTKSVPAGRHRDILDFNDISAPGSTTFNEADEDRLAVRLYGVMEGNKNCRDDHDVMTIWFDCLGRSNVTSPSPGATYPTPELPTIALMSIGFLGLGGYVWLRHRRSAAAVS